MVKLRLVPTEVNRLYDLSLASFKPKPGQSFVGTKLRTKLEIDSQNSWQAQKLIDEERERLEKEYPGAEVYVRLQFTEQEPTKLALSHTDQDRENVTKYVSETAEGAPWAERATELIAYFLKKAGVRSGLVGRRINFKRVVAENVLPFKKVDLPLDFQGVRLVTARNEDWQGTSNGGGKTSLLMLPRIALYGTTSKGQKHDDWVRRTSPERETAEVVLEFEDSNGKRYKVTRSRRHTSLKLEINGQNATSGFRTARTGVSTQELIERAVGLREDGFDHTIAIDQKLLHMAHGFLRGSDKDRKDLLEQFLGLERFQEAGKLAADARKKWTAQADFLENRIVEWNKQLEELDVELKKVDAAIRDSQAQKRLGQLQDQIRKLQYSEERLRQLEEKRSQSWTAVAMAEKERDAATSAIREVESNLQALKSQFATFSKKQGTKCQVCLQEISAGAVARYQKYIHEQMAERKIRMVEARKLVIALEQKFEQAIRNQTVAEQQYEQAAQQREEYQQLSARIAELQQRVDADPLKKIRERLLLKRTEVTNLIATAQAAKTEVIQDTVLYEYCERALSRDGLVAFIFRGVTGPLNQAADFYSQLLSDGTIALRFRATKELKSGNTTDDFYVQVINAQGGEKTTDQSRGEEQLANFMCILCLRALGPESNLLLLDEPTEGLDGLNAKRFADGLEKLAERVPTVLLATHNEYLKSRFKDQNSYLITKRKGVAELTQPDA